MPIIYETKPCTIKLVENHDYEELHDARDLIDCEFTSRIPRKTGVFAHRYMTIIKNKKSGNFLISNGTRKIENWIGYDMFIYHNDTELASTIYGNNLYNIPRDFLYEFAKHNGNIETVNVDFYLNVYDEWVPQINEWKNEISLTNIRINSYNLK